MDIFGIFGIVLPLLSSTEFSLELCGLVLAICSFTGTIHKLENALNSLKGRLRRLLPFIRGGILGYLPTWKNIKRDGLSFINTSIITVIMCVIMMLTEPETRLMLLTGYEFIISLTWWEKTLLVIFSPVALYLSGVITGIVILTPIYLIMTAIWFVFWLLSRPPAGIMGSIGLALTLGTFSIKLFAA